MQIQYKQFKYKVVSIQKLDRKDQAGVSPVDLPTLVAQLDKPTKAEIMARNNKNKQTLTFQEKLYCYKDTAADDKRVMGRYHNFFNAFYLPYNNHGDIMLVPDDIWLMISLYLSKYIDQHAQKLRHHFVKHEGQKQLTIVQYATSVEESLKMEKEWDFFFQQIIKQIGKNTLPGTIEALSCDFSTTDEVYKLISTSIIMSSLKQYFTYGRSIMMCGINDVYFAGTRQDWVKVHQKVKHLQKFDVDGGLKKYVEHVEVIIKQFIDAYDDKPDVKWWNTIMTSQQRRVGSGGQKDTYIEGWILHLYGIYTKVEIGSLPKTLVNVPIKLVNYVTRVQKQLQLLADWVSVSKVNQNTYKPDIGMCILERARKTLQ